MRAAAAQRDGIPPETGALCPAVVVITNIPYLLGGDPVRQSDDAMAAVELPQTTP
ncbi:MAG: hypothetical protein ABI068_05670 [Ktedonobacterales bacterium]